LQNQNKRYCPLCRADVIQKANESKNALLLAFSTSSPVACEEPWLTSIHRRAAHMEDKLIQHLEQWFPKETKEKQAANEMDRRREMFGDIYVDEHPDAGCNVM
jgi:hypothetical protein